MNTVSVSLKTERAFWPTQQNGHDSTARGTKGQPPVLEMGGFCGASCTPELSRRARLEQVCAKTTLLLSFAPLPHLASVTPLLQRALLQ